MDHLEIPETLARLGGDVGLLSDLYAAFSMDAPSKLEKLETAIEAGNQTEARKQAHSLKGAAAAIGALRVRALAECMEKTVHELSENAARSLLAELVNEVQTTFEVMDQAVEEAKK